MQEAILRKEQELAEQRERLSAMEDSFAQIRLDADHSTVNLLRKVKALHLFQLFFVSSFYHLSFYHSSVLMHVLPFLFVCFPFDDEYSLFTTPVWLACLPDFLPANKRRRQ